MEYKEYCEKSGKVNLFQRSEIGIVIELYIRALKIKNIEYDVVRMLAQNDLNGYSGVNLYNSVEYCIRNNSIIDEKTIVSI